MTKVMYQKLLRSYVHFCSCSRSLSVYIYMCVCFTCSLTTKTLSEIQNVFSIRLLRLTSLCNWWIKREMCVISTVKISCLFSLFCFALLFSAFIYYWWIHNTCTYIYFLISFRIGYSCRILSAHSIKIYTEKRRAVNVLVRLCSVSFRFDSHLFSHILRWKWYNAKKSRKISIFSRLAVCNVVNSKLDVDVGFGITVDACYF